MSRPAHARISVLMTCFNRRALTLRCLESLARQEGRFYLGLYLVDDGCSDGTGDAVRVVWPGATVINGDGTLFWNGGMRLAWETAAAAAPADFYLWLNDDVVLDPGAVARLLSEAQNNADCDGAIIAGGNLRDPDNGAPTYGGQLRPFPSRPLRFVLAEPDSIPIAVEATSGNVVLVSAAAHARLGNLDPAFTHIYGDLDYALRARAAGVPVIAGSGFSGVCAGPDLGGSSIDRRLPRWRRLRLRLAEERKVHARDWRTFARRHSGIGPFSILYSLSPYLRILLGR